MNKTALILVGMIEKDFQNQQQAVINIVNHFGLLGQDKPYQNTDINGLKSALEQRTDDCNITLIVGGVGISPDDRAIRIASDFFNIPMEYDFDTGSRLVHFHALAKNDRHIYDCAWLPKGAIVLENEFGPAPGCIIERENEVIIIVPSLPGELTAILQNRVKPYIDNILHGKKATHTLMTFGLSDESLSERLKAFKGNINPSVTIERREMLHHITVSAMAAESDVADLLASQTMYQLFQLLGGAAFGADCETLEEAVVKLLISKGLRIATAESCTAGMLSSYIVNVPGASSVFDLGVTTYAVDKKINVIQVPAKIIQLYGEVSAETAVFMASGVRKLARSDIGVGITGIAGPGGGSPEKPVGLVYIAVSDKLRTVVRKLQLGENNDRSYIRTASTLHALDLVRRYLSSYPVPLKDAISLEDIASKIRSVLYRISPPQNMQWMNAASNSASYTILPYPEVARLQLSYLENVPPIQEPAPDSNSNTTLIPVSEPESIQQSDSPVYTIILPEDGE